MDRQLRLDPQNLPNYLETRGLAPAREVLAVVPAGDGNINWVRRVRLAGGRTLIVKQARPALERFPEYEVTTERIVFEARYYAEAGPYDAAHVCPRVVDFDESERVLVLEDLGDVERLDQALGRGADGQGAARALGGFLGAVHAGTAGRPELADRFKNDDMRRLHGDHIFQLPFHANEFPLSPALRERAGALWADATAGARAAEMYAGYLAPEGVLVHADVQAGNVLLHPDRPRLLDPEISHVGDPAFDMGILVAHLLLPALARGEGTAAVPSVEVAWQAYRDALAGSPAAPAFERVARYAAIECLRRTVGAARVPCVAADEAGLRVFDAARTWLHEPPDAPAQLR